MPISPNTRPGKSSVSLVAVAVKEKPFAFDPENTPLDIAKRNLPEKLCGSVGSSEVGRRWRTLPSGV